MDPWQLKLGIIDRKDVGTKIRSLKRFLGLRPPHTTSHHGGIEHLLPGRITGWVVSANSYFHEVRLLVGQQLIARVEVNQPRPDVCEKLSFQGKPGFSLQLPEELPTLDWNEPARLLAISVDGGIQSEIELISDPKHTGERLRSLLRSDLLGLEGHFDGVVSGALQGWAARSRQHQPAEVWLQAEGSEPISIRCEQLRGGMAGIEMPSHCGFRLTLSQLPSGWEGKSVWCSFDRDDKYRLPQNKEVIVPITSHEVSSQPQITNIVTSYRPQIDAASEDLRKHWEALEDFRQILDILEESLNRRETLAGINKQQPRFNQWWKNLLRGS